MAGEKVLVKFLTGSRLDIEDKITSGDITEGSVIFTNDTDELCFVNGSKEPKFMRSIMQRNHTVAVGAGALQAGSTVYASSSLDDFVDQLLGEPKITITTTSKKYWESIQSSGVEFVINIETETDLDIDEIYIYMDDGNEERPVKTITDSTRTYTYSTTGGGNNIKIYKFQALAAKDNKLVGISNTLEFMVSPVQFCDCSSTIQNLTISVLEGLYALNTEDVLFGEMKNQYLLNINSGYRNARFIIRDTVDVSKIKIYADDQNITDLFVVTSMTIRYRQYHEFKYTFPLSFPNEHDFFTVVIDG